MLRTGFFLIWFMLPAITFAQWDPPARIEFNAADKAFDVIKANNRNLLVISAPEKDNGQSRKKWTFTTVGPDLQPIWETKAEILSDHTFQASETVDQVTCLMFTTYSKRRYSGPDYQLVILNHGDKTIKTINGKSDQKASFVAFDVIHPFVIGAFNQKNKSGSVFIYNSDSEEVKTITISPGNDHQILDLKVDRSARQFIIAFNSAVSKRKDNLAFQSFDLDGSLVLNSPVQLPDESLRIINAYLAVPESGKWILNGVFSKNSDRVDGTEANEEILANGVCQIRFINGTQEVAKFYNFIDFQNIEEIFNRQDGASVYKKMEKEKKKDADADLKFSIILLPPIQNGDNYIFLLETYSTEYQVINRYSYDFYGRVYPQSYSVFDGYRYFNAFSGEFDINGSLLWTHGIDLKDIKNFDLTRHVELYKSGNEVVMAYSSDGKIASRVISQYAETGPFERARIDLKYQGDQLVNDTRSQIRHWHDHYFYASGYQTVRNSSLKTMTRKVFYINKLSFETN